MKKKTRKRKEPSELIRVRQGVKNALIAAAERSGRPLVEEASRAVERGLATALAQS